MSPAVSRRLERRRCKRAASRLLPTLSSFAAIAIVVGSAHPTGEHAAALSVSNDVHRLAAASHNGFGPAERLAPPTQTAQPTPPAPPDPVISGAQTMLDVTNAERARRGLAPLQRHASLDQAAAAHAADQFNRGCRNLSHVGTNGSRVFNRIDRTGYSYQRSAENLACGTATAAHSMSAWMGSSPHRSNILNESFTHIGLSASRDAFGTTYWVQVFATPA